MGDRLMASGQSTTEKTDQASQPQCPLRRCCHGIYRWLPRPEILVLALALLWTIAAKGYIVLEQQAGAAAAPFVEAIVPDLIFFLAVTLLFLVLATLEQRRIVPRVTLILASLVLGWSVLNASWLITTSVQLQPGVLGVLLQTTSAMGPMVATYLGNNLLYAIPLAITVLLAVVWLGWRLISPLPLQITSSQLIVRIVLAGALLSTCIVVQQVQHRRGITAYSGQVLAFSSHWYALMNITGERMDYTDIDSELRELPRVGERVVGVPDLPRDERPNVVIVLLESVPHAFTSLPDSIGSMNPPVPPESDLTPALARLAEEGVNFHETRVPIPQTTKAFWATFAGSMPEVRAGYIESILVDRPYESLASILRRAGYRSGFFQMSTGTFECLPGVFANLDFDWAWFFENLEDPSKQLSALTGDDVAMIPIMFDWVDESDDPFLLTMITTVAHDPYRVPEWFMAEQSTDRAERFVDTVRYTDYFLERVLNELDERGLSENTIVCVIGDHGEAFRAESRRGRWVPFEEVIRVPWVMRWPGRIEPGLRIDEPVSQIDVTPTLLQLMGFDISEAGFTGVDALGPLEPDRRMYFSSWYINSPTGYVEGDIKYTYWPAIDTVFRYNLADDPFERSPTTVDGSKKAEIIHAIRTWEAQTQFSVPARRFREDVLYNHWRVFSAGRTGRSYYIPSSEIAAHETAESP